MKHFPLVAFLLTVGVAFASPNPPPRNNGVQPIPPPSGGRVVAGAQDQKLSIGNTIRTLRVTKLWVTPPTAGAYGGVENPGVTGRLTEGPIRSVDVWWWKVNFDEGLSGWVAQRDIQRTGDNTTVTSPSTLSARGSSTASNSTPSAPAPNIYEISPANTSIVNTPKVVVSGRVNHDIYPSSQLAASLNGTPVILDKNGRFSASVTLIPGTNDVTILATSPNPRQQTTVITAFIDGSMVYGCDTNRATALRSFQGGCLKTSTGNLLPFNTNGLENANDAHLFPDKQLFLSGDVRANENLELSAIQTLFMREHNQIANALASANPKLGEEQLYQAARRLVIAEIQNITFNEFLPTLLGSNAIRPYSGYDPEVNPGIANEFSAAAFRIGHTMVNDDIKFLDNEGNEIRTGLALSEAFFNPAPLVASGPDPLLKYLSSDNAQEVDTQIVESLRNFLFGPPGAGGLDLASLNIQRGRDHGLADYNTVRTSYGLPVVSSFSQITSDTNLAARLAAAYPDFNSLDLWVGGLAEDHAPGSSVGPTFRKIIANQFERVRDGDRNWHERTYSGRQLAAIRATRLSDIIRRNTSLTKLQDNVFFYSDSTTLPSLTAKQGSLPLDLIQGPGSGMPPIAIDGTGNNPRNTAWGAVGADLLRLSVAAYSDGSSTPSGTNRPGARLISNKACVQETDLSNNRNLSSWSYGWGQFIDHDMDLTTTGDTSFNIPIPAGDPSFDPFSTGAEIIPFSRSNYDTTTGSSSTTTTSRVLHLVYKPLPNPPPKKK